MSTLKQVQGEVALRMRRGEAFASVEVEVIDPSGLSDAEKGALWLYGWSFVDWRRQRREAMAHIDVLAGAPVPKNPRRKHLHLAEVSSPSAHSR
jgi:hypothetical protein